MFYITHNEKYTKNIHAIFLELKYFTMNNSQREQLHLIGDRLKNGTLQLKQRRVSSMELCALFINLFLSICKLGILFKSQFHRLNGKSFVTIVSMTDIVCNDT